jgi:phytoene dehydrogenase-like protein
MLDNNQNIQDSYEVVVVGAGNGGLTAATELAMKGVKVLLIEQHNLPGGFATSFVRGRFEFETSLHELNSWGPDDNKGGVRNLLEGKFGLDTEFLPVPEAYRLITTRKGEAISIALPFGIENFIESIEKAVPGSKEGLKKFFEIAEECSAAFDYIGKMKGKPDQSVLFKDFTNFLRTAAYSASEVQTALDIPQKAIDIMSAYWCYLGLPLNRINFTIFAMMLHSYLTRGAYIPKKRSNEFTSALDLKIREFGGHILYNTRVEKILVENGKVIGIETSKGDKINTNHIVVNVSPTLVYNKLIYPKSEVPEIAYKDINARIHGLSAFVVYLGLNASAEEIGLSEYSYFIMETMNTEKVYESWSKLKAPIGQATVCLNVANPGCSPPGTSILYITTLFRPEVWYDVKQEDYVKIKNEIAEELIKQFEKATHTQITKYIEEIEIATPVTFARYTRTYNGIIYGYELEPWDSLLPRFMMMNEDNYIDGLEFCGGFWRRGHGYSSSLASGSLAALLTLAKLMKGGGKNE